MYCSLRVVCHLDMDTGSEINEMGNEGFFFG